MNTFLRFTLASTLGMALPQMALANPTVLQINSSLPDGSFAHVFLTEYEQRVEAALPDQVDVQIFMGNTLGSEEDVLQGLGFGTHHASLSASAVVQINPRAAIFDLPYLFADRAAVQTFAASPAGDMLAEGFAGNGMRLAALWDNGFRVITNSVRPIVTPEDLVGLKIRTPTSRQRVEMFNTLGANATPLSFGEVYSALDQGVVDGQENPAQITESARLYEVQDYMSMSNHVYLPTFLLFGEPFLAGLDPEVSAELLTIAADMAGWTFDWGDATDETVVAELADKIAINAIDFPAFQAAALPLYDSPTFVDTAGADMVTATKAALGIE
ncbi:TRAP transporter substrate-binding protein [Roseicitreum antarcticum]|uniref:Tripartite ATP-independent transporter solute receptor, DctP family n=1 Tax=Roseicitreum antarcticum TaxID=564137 RepID=A0A1H2XPP9_9RHOB|nr:TRAP transporter substrate-binding protein [Roseicitreum antarcticum]SDW94882.1 tripartite ATP-independent transporter solute receptor, DctP family [Roseicitreum antarcticum]